MKKIAIIEKIHNEGLKLSNSSLKNRKVILSPHAATFTKECLENMSEETVQNIIDFFEKKIEPTKIVQL